MNRSEYKEVGENHLVKFVEVGGSLPLRLEIADFDDRTWYAATLTDNKADLFLPTSQISITELNSGITIRRLVGGNRQINLIVGQAGEIKSLIALDDVDGDSGLFYEVGTSFSTKTSLYGGVRNVITDELFQQGQRRFDNLAGMELGDDTVKLLDKEGFLRVALDVRNYPLIKVASTSWETERWRAWVLPLPEKLAKVFESKSWRDNSRVEELAGLVALVNKIIMPAKV